MGNTRITNSTWALAAEPMVSKVRGWKASKPFLVLCSCVPDGAIYFFCASDSLWVVEFNLAH